MKEVSLKLGTGLLKLIENFEGNVRLTPALLGNEYLVLISSFPGKKAAQKAIVALSKLTGISFEMLPLAGVEEFSECER